MRKIGYVLMVLVVVMLGGGNPVSAGEKEELQLKVSNAKLAIENIKLSMQILPIQLEQVQKVLKEMEAELSKIESMDSQGSKSPIKK